MTALTRPFRRLVGRSRPDPTRVQETASPAPVAADEQPGVAIEIPESDPLFAYLQSAPGPVDLTHLELSSPALEQLREAGVALVVPLVTQGELIGTLNLGPRLSEQDYSSDDRRLLGTLAAQAAPAMRVGQLVRQQQAEARRAGAIEQELKIAQIIQQQFLPQELPDLPELAVAAFYRPARTVGGDFYDFIALPDGRVMFVVGDVTDKGVPAALVMASTHALLRADAPRLVAPGAVLGRVNDLLCADIPAHMFVTCLAHGARPATGQVTFANAGHNLPYVRTTDERGRRAARDRHAARADARHDYEESEAAIEPGDSVLLLQRRADRGARRRTGEMFGFPRAGDGWSAGTLAGEELIDLCLTELTRFTGPGCEQEDDITLVAAPIRASAGVSPRIDWPLTSAGA